MDCTKFLHCTTRRCTRLIIFHCSGMIGMCLSIERTLFSATGRDSSSEYFMKIWDELFLRCISSSKQTKEKLVRASIGTRYQVLVAKKTS
mmetsp:Transcript_20603/g.42361  ORF Transcript_20603/g.42361 Transcript_20603/m.42361 type:complete len:90 (+) Transcript_20603:41-310(+)